MIKGIARNKALAGLVVHVHDDDVEMTDLDGELVHWRGRMPVIDVVLVDRAFTKPRDEILAAGEKLSDYIDPDRGEIVHAQKIAWSGDIESKVSFKNLPPMMVESAPRYIVIGEVVGV